MDNPNVNIPVNFSNYVWPLHWQGEIPLLEFFVSGYNNEDSLTNFVGVVEMVLVFFLVVLLYLLQGDVLKLFPLNNDLLLEEHVDTECTAGECLIVKGTVMQNP